MLPAVLPGKVRPGSSRASKFRSIYGGGQDIREGVQVDTKKAVGWPYGEV